MRGEAPDQEGKFGLDCYDFVVKHDVMLLSMVCPVLTFDMC